MKDFVEKYFSNRWKKFYRSLWKMKKKMVSTSRKCVSPTTNKLSIAVIFFKNWITPDFNNGIKKKVQNPFPLARIRSLFKDWIPPIISISRKEGNFWKIWFFLISIMVSTSRNKSCKILSCLGEIVFFYSEFFACGNHYRKVEANFLKKLLCPSRNCFSG